MEGGLEVLRDVHLIHPLAVLCPEVLLLFLLCDHVADDCDIFSAVLPFFPLSSDFSILIFFFLGEQVSDLFYRIFTCFFSCW